MAPKSLCVRNRRTILPAGPTGIGKSKLACALAHKACRDGYTALYTRGPTTPWAGCWHGWLGSTCWSSTTS